MDKLNIIDKINIETISKKTTYFGHMSVGNNILAGIEEILKQKDKNEKLQLNRIDDFSQIDSVGFYHSSIGKNGDPSSKITAFKEFMLDQEVGSKVEIAFFKFCYVDIKKDTDVNAVFDEYTNTIDMITAKYPDLKIIHFTCPLMIHSIKGRNIVLKIKFFVKELLLGDIDNVKRNEYNVLLRENYGINHTIFDLAKFESMNEDGRESTFIYKRKTFSCMQDDFSDDGGHLNKYGQKIIAKELLRFLTIVLSNFE